MSENIMLVSEQVENDMGFLPKECEKATKEFKLLTMEQLDKDEANQACTIRIDEGNELIPQKTLQSLDPEKCYALMCSPVILDCYYPIDRFEEYFKEDTRMVIHEIALYMGARAVEVGVYTKEEKEQHKESAVGLGGGVYLGVKGINLANVNAGIHGETAQEQTSTHEKGASFQHKAEQSITKKKTPKELKEWIEQERINLRALPAEFQSTVRAYLHTGEMRGAMGWSKFEKVQESIIDKCNFALGAQVEILKLPVGIGAEFNYKSQKNQKASSELYVWHAFDFGDTESTPITQIE